MPILQAKTGEALLTTSILYFGKRCLAVCDQKCNKAWGLNGGRPEWRDSTEPDDVIWFADGEVGEAPADPGSYEGGEGKPFGPPLVHNKWCVRECERSTTVDIGRPIQCINWSQRIYNQPWKHGMKTNPILETGLLFDDK